MQLSLQDNQHCVILGSAPNPTLSPRQLGESALWCVNGSGWSARRLGLPNPRCTLLSGWILTDKPSCQVTKEALRGLKTEILLLIPTGISKEQAECELKKLQYCYDSVLELSLDEREQAVYTVTGGSLGKVKDKSKRVSNGIAAACLAFACGASGVTLSGFSLDERSGYAYGESLDINGHIDANRIALTLLCEGKHYISTTEKLLSSEIGMPLVEGWN